MLCLRIKDTKNKGCVYRAVCEIFVPFSLSVCDESFP